jgi:hypothetical protein
LINGLSGSQYCRLGTGKIYVDLTPVTEEVVEWLGAELSILERIEDSNQ